MRAGKKHLSIPERKITERGGHPTNLQDPIGDDIHVEFALRHAGFPNTNSLLACS
jgi:hypothetical protein